MTIAQLILCLMIGTPQERRDLKIGWKGFCERHLVADDPYDELTRKLSDEQKEMVKKAAEKIKEEENE